MSGYSDSRKCKYCGNWIDPLELCDCDLSIADYIERRTTDTFNVAERLRRLVKKVRQYEDMV